ncbi:MAG TPA: DUF3014 domain-containing protein [Woeseiaceae bacterium]|nr:DUF3014 domain-containing protein [Woeseiaceae bacterium]
MRRESLQWIVPVVLALGVVAALWFYWSRTRAPEPPPEPATQAPEPVPEEEAPAGPAHPLPPPEPAAQEEKQLEPLPPLDQSDEYFGMALTGLFGDALDQYLVKQRLIERIVAAVDNLPREQLAERIKPLTPVPGRFAAQSKGDVADERYTLDPANYERYEPLVNMLAETGTADMVELYQRFYPLLQKAYVDLGYPDGYFNDRVVEVIDHLLATPEVEGPIELVRPNVLYEYADPELEALSTGQKALLRTGPENMAVIKAKLREFRTLITREN